MTMTHPRTNEHIATQPDTGNAVARKLENGMTVVLERLPYLHSASVGMWIGTGSGNESRKLAGVSHFLEHLFFKGTERRTARQLVEAIESKGGHINAFTAREYTCLYVKTLDTHVATGVEILADIIKNSTFHDLEKERNVVLEEIASIEDVPEDHAHELLMERIWRNHPMGRSITGYADTVSAMTHDDVSEYYRKWYRPRNMYFSVAGNFDEDAVLDQICLELGGLRPKGAAKRSAAPAFSGGVNTVDRDIGQDHVCLAFPGPTALDPRRYIYAVMSNALGGGSASRLFDRIREIEGLAYAIYSFHETYVKSGMFGVYAAVAEENLEKTIELTFEEIRKFRDAPMGPDELDTNREHLKGSLLMSLESSFSRMARMAKSMMYHERLVSVSEIIDAIDKVTADDVQQLAQWIFKPEACALLTLGPGGTRVPREIAL